MERRLAEVTAMLDARTDGGKATKGYGKNVIALRAEQTRLSVILAQRAKLAASRTAPSADPATES